MIARISYRPHEDARLTSVELWNPEVYGFLGASTIKGFEFDRRVGARTTRLHIIDVSLISGIVNLVQDRKYATWHQGRTVRVHKATIPVTLETVWLTEFNHDTLSRTLPQKPVLQVPESTDAIAAAVDWLVEGGMDPAFAKLAVQKSLNIQ